MVSSSETDNYYVFRILKSSAMCHGDMGSSSIGAESTDTPLYEGSIVFPFTTDPNSSVSLALHEALEKTFFFFGEQPMNTIIERYLGYGCGTWSLELDDLFIQRRR